MRKKAALWILGGLLLSGMWGRAWLRTPATVDAKTIAAFKPTEMHAPVAPPDQGSGPRLVRSTFDPAQQDPFVWTPPLPKAAIAVLPSAPPVPPPVPPLNLQFVGKVSTEQGLPLIYAVEGVKSVTLSQGLVLTSGHQISRVTGTHVELTHPLLDQPVVLALPAAPKQEIR